MVKKWTPEDMARAAWECGMEEYRRAIKGRAFAVPVVPWADVDKKQKQAHIRMARTFLKRFGQPAGEPPEPAAL